MCEKIKNFLKEPINIVGLLGIFWLCSLFYFNIEGYFLTKFNFTEFIESNFWLIIATIFIAIFAYYQAKFTEYSIRPSAYPLLFWDGTKTILLIRNESNHKILLNFRIRDSNKYVSQSKWEKPLHVFPGTMRYPSVLGDLDKNLKEEGGFEIEYKMASNKMSTKIFKDYPIDKWDWVIKKEGDDIKKYWIGPDGIEPEGIKLLLNNLKF